MAPKNEQSISSPDGRYLAHFSYFGRIAHDVGVCSVDTNNSSRILKPVFDTSELEIKHIFDDFGCNMCGEFWTTQSNNPWLNNTDLGVMASYKNKKNEVIYRGVIIRFKGDTWKVIKIGKPE